MKNKRPIASQRDSAVMMEVGSADEGPIDSLITFGERLLIIKPHAVYEVALADHFDPHRSSPNVPNTHQLLISCGAKNNAVSKTLLTANDLAEKNFMPSNIDCDAIKRVSFEAAIELVALEQQCRQLQSDINLELERAPKGSLPSGYRIPTVPDIMPRCKYCLQRAHALIKSMISLVRLFYQLPSVDIDGFCAETSKRYGPDDTFTKFAESMKPFLLLIWHSRNAAEHTTPTQGVRLANFSIDRFGGLSEPSIEVIYSKADLSPTPLRSFTQLLVDHFPELYENLVAHLCLKHAALGNHELCIAQDEAPSRASGYRLRYMIKLENQWVPYG